MGRGNTQSRDPETEMSWMSWKNNKTSVAEPGRQRGKWYLGLDFAGPARPWQKVCISPLHPVSVENGRREM